MLKQVMRRLSRDILLALVASLLCSAWACSKSPNSDNATPGPMMGGPMLPTPGADAGILPPARVFEPEPARLHRLTRIQYLNTLRDLLGDELELPTDLEVDTPIYGFNSIGASSLTIAPRTAEQFEQAAYDMARRVMSSTLARASILTCEPRLDNSDCVFANANKAIEFVLAGLLQSPYFLFRVELGSAPENAEGHRPYSAYEMASRLSYLIWQSTPDATLLQAAADDALKSVEDIDKQVARMFSTPKARAGLTLFFREYLKLDRLDQLAQDADTFPQVTETLGTSMRTEILMLAEDAIFDSGGDVRKLFDAPATFVNAELARLYTIKAELPRRGFVRVDWPSNSPRGGILTSAGFLAINAHSNVTSPTLRGRFIRQFLLCQDIAPPPAGVVTTLPEPSGAPQTLRQRLETLHLADAQCAGCHSQMDPLGFGLENFDAIGAYRTTENGLAIDSSGILDGAPFKNARELSRVIAENPKFAQCLTRMVFRHAAGHLESKGEEGSLIAVYESFVASGHDFKKLVTAVVSSDAFRYAKVATP
jgi:hypothetical protein